MIRNLTIGILLIFLGGCQSSKDSQAQSCGAQELFKSYWDWTMKTFPTQASSNGWGARHNKLFDNTIENLNSIQKSHQDFLAKINTLLEKKSCLNETMSLSLLKVRLEGLAKSHEFEEHLLPFSSLGGPHTSLAQLHKSVPLQNLQNYRDYLERLEQIPRVLDQVQEMSRLGIKKGITPPQITFKDYDSSILQIANKKPTESPFYLPFVDIPQSISKKDQKDLQQRAQSVIHKKIKPAYKKLHTFWIKEYYPKLRKSIAAEALPRGKEYYRFRIQKMTTLNKSAAEIHKIGLAEVQRILGEMKKIKQKIGFKKDLQSFFKFLRTDKKFYAKTPQQLQQIAASILKKADGKLPKLFETLPKLPYGLEPIPNYIAHKSPVAYYRPGNMKTGTAAAMQINLTNLPSRPLYNLVALALHEAVPGHHLQLALSQELDNLPEFRKDSNGQTAFVEGWGLYAESLGQEMGLYETPYQDFGRLSYEQWRALRLVVDTGIHSMNWTRQQAITYMSQNSGLSEKNIIAEVDRYISWPGQALAYKIGELKIKELRKRAQSQLGKKFNIRKFHSAVLKHGAIPLPLLEKNINSYIKKSI